MLGRRKLWSRPLLWSYFKFMWSWPPPVFFSYYILVAYPNIHLFGQEAQKRQYFWNFTTFHTPCGHQIVARSTEKVVTWILWFFIALYRLVIYQNIYFLGQEAQKHNVFEICGHQIVVMNMKNSVTSILCFFLALQPCDINTYIC